LDKSHRWRGLYGIEEGEGGFGIIAISFLSPRGTEEGRGRRSAPAIRRRGGSAAALGRGKRGSGMWGIDSPTHLGPGRSEEAGRRGPAAAALLERGGGAGTEEGRRRWLWQLGCGGAAPVGPFIAVEMRWHGGGR